MIKRDVEKETGRDQQRDKYVTRDNRERETMTKNGKIKERDKGREMRERDRKKVWGERGEGREEQGRY